MGADRYKITFDDTYWGIETCIACTKVRHAARLLMIPIEELKPQNENDRTTWPQTFDDTYWGIETWWSRLRKNRRSPFWWYLLRNWNYYGCWLCQELFPFWWYLLRNWNSLDVDPQCYKFADFWWYLLRNWNRIAGMQKITMTFLLMIPIEELKHKIGLLFLSLRSPFWWYLLRNWNHIHQSDRFLHHHLLMIPIEELKLCGQVVRSFSFCFWWYLLRNWNHFKGNMVK